MDEGVEIEDLGVWCTGLEARNWPGATSQVPLNLGVHSYNLPSEVNLSSGGGTPWLRDGQARGF